MPTDLHYFLKGRPASRHVANDHLKTWNTQKEARVYFQIQLDGQHEGKPTITGPIDMQLLFFMPIITTKRKIIKNNQIHVDRPFLTDLIVFVQDICCGIIYDKPGVITSITAKKRYSSEPRTEIFITKL
jgi:Holliday junction resolvase RusA-like endonuclease